MRFKKNRKTTPEEAIRQAVETWMEMNFDYNQIQDRLDIDEIARVGAIRHGQKTEATAPVMTRVSRRPAVAAVLMTALILGATLGTGGVLIAHFAEQPTPPVVESTGSQGDWTSSAEPATTPSTEVSPDGAGTIVFYPEDTLTWEGVTYVRTDVEVSLSDITGMLGEVEPAQTVEGHDSPDRAQSDFTSASCLEIGSPFFEIEGCQSTLYVAVWTDMGYVLYMVEDAEAPDLP
ncbi:MAG: hypothetical protein IJX72_07360 [Clostridia bacterium]|nr:hypothetical protein [Clostridia bacterium]